MTYEQLRRMAVAITISASLAAGPIASAYAKDAPPVVMTRTGPWHVNWGDDSCMLLGAFGADERERVILRIVQFSPGPRFRLTFVGDRFKNLTADATLHFDFGPVVENNTATGLAGTMGKTGYFDAGPTTLYSYDKTLTTAPQPTPEMENAVSSLTFWGSGLRRTQLNLGSMKGPMAALRKCMDDLVKSWGFDPAVIAGLTREVAPTRSPGNWLHAQDYPTDALAEGQMAVVAVRLDVDESGNVANCHVQESTRPISFGDLSCRLISRRAKFTPALDAAGKPTKTYFNTTIKWVMGL